jgi:hypothetical protein
MGTSQTEFRENRPNNKLKLWPKIYVFHCTLYVCNNIIKGVRYSKLCLVSPPPQPLLPTRYITALLLGDQRFFMHQFNI